MFPKICAHFGIPKNGNIKPDSNMEGKKKKYDNCVACN